MIDAVFLLIIGFFSGIFGGLLGIGGSIILLPALSIFFAHRHPPEYQHLYQGAAMIMNFFVAIPAVLAHRKKGTFLPAILKYLIPAALLSMVLGVTCSNLPLFQGPGAIYLKKLLGLFLLYVMGYNAYRLFIQNRFPDVTPEIAQTISPWKTSLGIGFPMGFSGGLLGIGGGILGVPLQQVFLKIPLHRAVANSSATIVCISLLGALYKASTIPASLGRPLAAAKFAVLIIPTSIIGGYLGARLIYILPRTLVRFIFSLLMLYAGLRLILA